MNFEESEIRKCAANFQYFCENYVKIVNSGKGGLIHFKLYPYQLRVVSDIEKHRFNIVKKFRQAGLTTLASIYGLWKCMFDLDQRILVISKTDREATAIGRSISDIIEHLPDWLKPEMKSDAKHEKYFSATNSIMWFYTPEAGRSKSASFLIIDEAAFIKKMDEHYKALYPTIAAVNGKVFVISTVNGNGNWYADTYKSSKEGRNHYNPIDLHYLEHPDYCKPEFEKMTRANLTEKAWNQEFLCQFGSSGDTYINASVLAEIEKSCTSPRRKLFPEWDETLLGSDSNPDYEKGSFWEWLPPRASCQYIISVDASFGLGENSDNSSVQVIDLTNFEQVAEFQSNTINTLEFAKVISQIGAVYNEAMIVVEACGPGIPVLQHLEKMNYPNLYYSTKGKGNMPGVAIDKSNRELIMDNFKTCLTNNLVKINSVRLHAELNTFVINRITKKPQAAKGYHDDLIMAFAIAIYASEIVGQGATIIPNNNETVGKDLISDAIKVEGLKKIRDTLEFEVDENDDFQWADEVDGSGFLSEVANFDPRFQRKNDTLLRNFGM